MTNTIPTEFERSDAVPGVVSGNRPRIGTTTGSAAVLTAGIGLALVGAHALSIPTPPCPLRWSTGVPCPFCGLTHLARELLGGQIGLVASHDPAGLALAVILAVAVVTQLIAVVRRRQGGPRYMTSRIVGLAVVGVLAAHWVTTIVTGGILTA